MRASLKISMLAGVVILHTVSLLAQPCPCFPPNAEQEPNDAIPVAQTLFLGESICGEITTSGDVDYVNLELTTNTTVGLTIQHNDVPPGCLPGLNPIVDLLAPDGQMIARCGDQSDASTDYATDFRIGPGTYLLRVSSGFGTTGYYQVAAHGGAEMPPPEPELTIIKSGPNTMTIYWQQEYLPGETIEIERAPELEGPYSPVTSAPATNLGQSIFMFPFPAKQFFRAHASGARQLVSDPWTGSLISLSNEEEPDGSPIEGDDVIIDEIEFAVNGDDEIVIGKLLGHDPDNPLLQLVQDNSDAYGGELTPIDDWAGHTLEIYGRTITVSHMSFARDEVSGDVGIVDGRGVDQSSGETLMFGDLPQEPEGDAISFIRFGFDEPDPCCRVKTIAFCGPFGIRPAPAGMPCPCPYAPNQTTCPPGPLCQPCNTCTLRVDMTGTLRRCICAFDPAPFGQPPAQIFCTFKPRWKCKQYECLSAGQECEESNCPGPNSFIPGTPTPFGRANCKKFCVPG